MKIYISFGHSQGHKINGVVFDINCLAEIECETHAEGREKAFALFGDKFFTDYSEETAKHQDTLKFFPRGIIPVGPDSQLDIPSGRKLRDKGIERATNNAERKNPGWISDAYHYLEAYPHKVFMAEDVRVWAHKNGLQKPPHARAWGSVMVRGKKNGLIKERGFQNVKNPKAHRTPCRVWEKVK